MPDNVGYTPGTGATVAADDIGGVLHQRVKIGVGVDGSATDVSSTNPMPVQEVDPSTQTAFGPVTTASTVLFSAVDTANERTIVLQLSGSWDGGVYLQASQDGTTWWACQGFGSSSDVVLSDTFYNPDIITVPVVARYFRAVTTPDFSGSISGSYSLRAVDVPPFWNNSQLVAVDPSVTMPVGGVDPSGYVRRMALAPSGGVFPADGTVVTGSRQGASVGPIVLVDTAGYGSVVLQLAGTFTGTITFQASNDLTTWTAVAGWPVAGGAAPVTTATAVGQWVFPAAGRYFRAQITTAGTGVPLGIVVLRNFSAWMPLSSPSIAANQSVNVAQVAGGAITGGIPLTSTSATNGQTLARFSQTVTTPAATQIKATAGRLTQLTISNGGTVAGFLHLYNVATSVTLGTTTDVHCYAIPGNVANFGIALPDGGLYFSAGIGAAFTAGSANNDNTAFGSAPTLIANYAFV